MTLLQSSRGGAALAVVAALLYIHEEDYYLDAVVDAPLGAVYELLSSPQNITAIHPKLSSSRILSQERHAAGALLEWELQTSAIWAAPFPFSLLQGLTSMERVSTVAMRQGDERARITNTGLAGYRGKLVPFYYYHWWDLTAVPGEPGRTAVREYELLKGCYLKFLLGAMDATQRTHKAMQANLIVWAKAWAPPSQQQSQER